MLSAECHSDELHSDECHSDECHSDECLVLIKIVAGKKRKKPLWNSQMMTQHNKPSQ